MLSRVDAQPGHSEHLLVALSVARANRSSSAQTSVKEDNVEGKILQLVLEQNGDIMLLLTRFIVNAMLDELQSHYQYCTTWL